jgi:predicted MFS family arabinose efflux permease
MDKKPMDKPDDAGPSRRSQRGLDWLSFFIADVQTGFGPFVAVYLATRNWSPGEIGLVLAIGGIASVLSQAPGGALVDAISAKRLLIGSALAMIAAGALLLALWPSFWPVVMAELLHGGTGGVIKPGLAAIGLGLVGHSALSGRLGRNQRFNSFGNALTAGLMGLLGYFASTSAPFFAAAALCLPAALALATIRGRDIDYAEARSAADRNNPRKGHRVRDAARNRHLHVFILCLVLFQFANASLVPLVGGRLGYQHEQSSELVTSGVVVVPQIVAALIATWIARRADDWGRKPLLLVGLGAVAVRAVLFAVTGSPWMLLLIQPLDGVSAAVIGVMMPLVIADLTRGTGRYNLAQGYAGTAIGIGVALSTGGSGYIVQHFGYAIGFFGLAAIGLIGCAVLYWFFPETKPRAVRPGSAHVASSVMRSG